MKKSRPWIVGKEGVRVSPGLHGLTGNPNECFYCNQKIGDIHAEDCVIRKRTVVARFSVDLVVKIPEFWTAEDAEEYWNERNFYIDNFHYQLTSTLQRLHDCDGCEGPSLTVKLLRDATEQDEEDQNLFIEDSENDIGPNTPPQTIRVVSLGSKDTSMKDVLQQHVTALNREGLRVVSFHCSESYVSFLCERTEPSI